MTLMSDMIDCVQVVINSPDAGLSTLVYTQLFPYYELLSDW